MFDQSLMLNVLKAQKRKLPVALFVPGQPCLFQGYFLFFFFITIVDKNAFQ